MIKREVYDIGETVLCDLCGEDYTQSAAEGGFQFVSKGVCPACAPAFEKTINEYGEQEYIRGRAKPGETFRDFILRLRGGNNRITITHFEPDEEQP